MENPKWNSLLQTVLEQPGLLHACYSKFHNFSIGNTILGYLQLAAKGLDFGPMATYSQWQNKHGRNVRKGEKAISLWQPITAKKVDEATGKTKNFVMFIYKAGWFALSQTEGKELELESAPDWSFDQALKELKVTLEPFNFALVGPNCQGYAYKRSIAINPLCQKVLATELHELAHVVLGHTDKDSAAIIDRSELDRSIKELEAEATAMLCLDTLGHTEMAVFNRGYIQHWMASDNLTEVPEESARRIFAAADKILKAGRIAAPKAAELAIA